MFQSTKQLLRPMALLMGLFPFLHGTSMHAAETDLSDSPLSSASTADVKPNILFTLDDSGSMNWRSMPDGLGTREHKVGFRNSSCNLVYYNPATRYVIPKTSTGLDVNAAAPTTYTAAYENGFGTYMGWEESTSTDSGATWTPWTAAATCSDDQVNPNLRQCRVVEVASAGPTLNLSSNFRAFVSNTIDSDSNNRKTDTAQPAYYWNYLGSTKLIPIKGDCEFEVTPVFNIKRATYSGGVATFEVSGLETRTSTDSGTTWTPWTAIDPNTPAPECTPDTTNPTLRECRQRVHGLAVGQQVGISVDPAGYQGIFTVASVPTARTFTVALATNPGNYRRVSQLQRRTSTDSGLTWTAWANVSTCTEVSTGANQTECQVSGGTAGAGYTATCTPSRTGSPGSYAWTGNASAVDCRINNGTGAGWNATNFATVKEICTDGSITTTTCAAAAKTALWRKVVVSATSGPASVDINGDTLVNASDADERTNFANWYSYYGNRLKMMKSASGRAFLGMTDSKRIGFITINPEQPVVQSKFITIKDFDVAQKADWFKTLYSQSSNGSTPLRTALSRAGRYFAAKTDGINRGMSGDPVQYSCQQNFTILTTDGYWNGAGGVKLNGTTAMDNQDGIIEELDAYRSPGSKYQMSPRPIFDGASTTFNWNTARRYYRLNNTCVQQEKKTAQEQGRLGQWQQQTSQLQKTTGQVQYSTNLQIKTGPLEYQSRIQSKTGQLQYTTNLESRTGALEYQSKIQSKTGQLEFTTNLQSRAAPLEYQSKIQSKTGQLEFTTNLQSRATPLEYQSKIQSKTGQLQYTTNLQSRAAPLEYQSKIQSKTGQLQYRSNLERKRGQLQYQSKIESRTGQLQRRTLISFFPIIWSSWNSAASCTPSPLATECRIDPSASFVKAHSCTDTFDGTTWTGGASAVECRNTGVLDGTWDSIATCTPSADVACQIDAAWAYRPYGGTCTSTVSGATWTGDANATDCRTIAFNPTWTDRATCDTTTPNVECRVDGSFVKAHSCAPTRVGTFWSGDASAVECNNTGALDGAWTPIASCTPSSDVSCRANPDTVTYPWGYVTAYAPTCASTVSGPTWTSSGGNATECQTAAFNPAGWTNRGTCDTATPNVQCRVNASFVKAHSCTTTLSGTNWTGGVSAIECNNTGALDGAWTPIASCVPSSDVSCRANPDTVTYPWTYVTPYAPTCTSTVSGPTWTSSGGNATECRTAAFNPAGWTARATCDTATPNVQCRVNASFVKAHSCTTTLSGTNWTGGASAIECNNTGALDGTWTPIASCTPSSDVFCRANPDTVAYPWGYVTAYAPTCTSTVSGPTWTSSGGNATECRAIAFNPAGWTARATCDTATPNVQCRVNASFVKTDSCTTTLSGTNWTGGASAVECNNTGALDGTWTPIASCTPSSDVFCRINPAPAWSYVTAYAPTCTSTVSGPTWTSSGGNATECRAIAFNPAGWTNRATCDTATPNVQCRVNASFVKTDSCTTTLSGTNWTGGASAVECSTGALDGTWTPIASCTPSTDVFCRVNGTFTDVTQAAPTCTSTVSGATWTSSGGIATDCSTAGGFTAWVNAPTCTESTNFQCRVNGPTVGVQPTVPLDVTSAPCNAQTRSGSPGSYVYTGGAAANYCETVVTAPFVDVAYACTPDVNHDAAGRTIQCQFRDPMAWANTPSCTMNATTDCRTVDVTPWAAASNCVEVTTPDATGLTTQCRPTGVPGFKLEVQGETISQAYSGPNQTGTTLGSATTNRETTWSDSVPGTCFAAAPAVPGVETVVGVGPPTPPANCNSGTQIWPCETYTSGVTGGVTANIASATWTPPGEDPSTQPAYATFVTTAAHLFLAGHSVTIAGGDATLALYRGDWQIVEVPDDSVPANTQFKVLMPGNPGGPVVIAGGTASLFAGSSNSLADVAQYYYKTDLRTPELGNCTGVLGTSVCDNNVPSTGAGIEDDRANWQHMTTFTMGLGLDGTLLYSPTYRTDICVAKSITAASWAANVATVTTSAPHGFVVNQAVTISGGDVAGYRGQTKVASVPTATTFTYALTASPGAGVFGSGTATGCGDFVRLREGTINWPVPTADGPTALDDLWHAAVNGRGQYFSAGNPDTVVASLTDALAGINARVAAAAAAATSNLEPVAGDNFAYTAKYKTQAWTGDLEAKEIDLTTGSVRETVIWSAQAKLDDQTKTACDNRTIKLFRSGATDNLVDFKWNTYGCDSGGAPTGLPVTTLDVAEQANFNAAKVALLSQFPSYGTGAGVTVDQRTPAAGANLVNFLRGQRGKEGFSSAPPVTNTDVNKLYRTREHVLGAIINAQPVFVKGPFAEYDDPGYATFKVDKATRTPIVYASANDGMLHAILAGSSIVDPDGGKESWAFMPSMVLPNLYKLASENYASNHTYSVDGTPVVGDVYDPDALPSPTWKTILVSGMNKGAKGYFALDVTDPAAPKALWEFKHDAANCVTVDATSKAPATPQYSDCHIGYTYSNPIISKLKGGADDGRWVVFVTSGYNNVNSPPAPGDGEGYLYVLEAMTGKLLYKIGTGAGTAADPSGLNHISAWSVNPLRNNTTERIYGGDLLGNVWRFDVNDLLNAAGREAQLVANVQDEDGVGQPITTRPELAEVGGAPFVYVATGRYLGPTDLGTGQKNSVWALRDALGATPMADPRGNLRKLIITTHGSGTSAFRTNGCTTQCDPTDGWFVDLPDPGERVNIDMKLQLGTLVVASNVPETNACNIGGYAWLNYFNNGTGLAIANSADQAVGRRLVGAGGSESLAVGLNIVRLPSGKTVVIATTSAAQQLTVEAPFDVAPPSGKRVSWREIVQ